MKGDAVYLSTGAIQPIAAKEVSAALADVAESAPVNGITEIAGPERFSPADLVSRFLVIKGGNRKVVADPEARYFGSILDDKSIVPLGEARLGKITFSQWLETVGNLWTYFFKTHICACCNIVAVQSSLFDNSC